MTQARRIKRGTAHPAPPARSAPRQTRGEGRMDPFPVTFAETQQWACLGVADPDMFFPTTVAARDAAITCCGRCPVRKLCEERGRRGRFTGVWGGVLLENGRPIDGLLHADAEQRPTRKVA